MKTTLVVMAAGIGSRYGAGIKQLEKMDDQGHIIVDFSIYDAIEAGFDKVVFVIRRSIEKDFKEIIGERIAKYIDVDYAFQEYDESIRSKPYGTGHAILSTKGIVNEPMCIINADDYYGKKAFKLMHDFLVKGTKDFSMAGFILKNTLSANGVVTRGVCEFDDELNLTKVIETSNISSQDGVIAGDNGELSPECLVSMNMWGVTPNFIDHLETGFEEFLKDNTDPKSEYLLPNIIDQMIHNNEVQVKVLKTDDKWFGVTYIEDKEEVINNFKELLAQGAYPKTFFE